MKKHSKSYTVKELLKELSVIPLFVLFLSVVLLIGYLLPDGLLKRLPFEVLCALGVIVILGLLYVASGIVMAIQKIRSRSNQATRDADTH